ncbi:MAG: diguanylate cyclase domain-containing protein [Wenzhouxiangella sp.]
MRSQGSVLVVEDSLAVAELLVEKVSALTGARCLTASTLAETRALLARFLKGGASDFLHKSFSTEELFCRVDQNIDMLLSLAEARHASNHDYLTGLPNRRDFMRRASPVHEAAVSDSSGLVVAILDADHFKQINDQFGHHFGDLALVAMADALREAAGPDGLCARMGGEEFAILLPRYSQAQAEAVLEALRAAVAAIVLPIGDQSVSFTVSIGATSRPGKSLEEMLDRADAALYQAKSNGRDRVVFEG